MLETEIIKLREAVEALTQTLTGQGQKPTLAQKKDLIKAEANETQTPDKTPEKPVTTLDTTPETIPINQELQSLCAALVRKNPEWREVIKSHLTDRNAVKVADLNDADRLWFKDWMTRELA